MDLGAEYVWGLYCRCHVLETYRQRKVYTASGPKAITTLVYRHQEAGIAAVVGGWDSSWQCARGGGASFRSSGGRPYRDRKYSRSSQARPISPWQLRIILGV